MAPISTKDIPQADSLDEVIVTVEAVSQGKSTFQDIAQQLGLTERQGRYYRRAAEILRFITRVPGTNISTITALGAQLLKASRQLRTQILTNQILGVPIVQSVVGMLASSGGVADRRNLELSMRKIVPTTTPSMADRRLTTVLAWLEYLDITSRDRQQVIMQALPASVDKIEISDPDTPILPKPGDLRLFDEVPRRVASASNIVKFEVDRAKLDRANAVHERLRSLLAARIKEIGSLPTYNKYIDLAVEVNGRAFLIEVKSSGNTRTQVRRGISQLYEYRYLQCLPEAVLVLLLEKPLAGENAWMLHYLINDRNILVIWDARNEELFTTKEGLQELPFMRSS